MCWKRKGVKKMTDVNEQKRLEAGKKDIRILEQYNVREAVTVAEKLGQNLIDATAHAKNHFRNLWLQQLCKRYKHRPGKPLVHLNDLADSVMPTIDPQVSPILHEPFQRFVSARDSRWIERHFRNIADLANERTSRPAKLRTWKKFSKTSNFQIDLLE